jgi:Tol biopolymer transport system component
VRLTDIKNMRLWPPRWSPDGKTLLFEARGDSGPEIHTVPADAKGPVPTTRVVLGSSGSWAHDGKSIYYVTRGQIWKAAADGANPRPVETEPGANLPQESPDGKSIYFRQGGSIRRMPAEGGAFQDVVSDRNLMFTSIQPAAGGLYFMEFAMGERGMVVSFQDVNSRSSRPVFHLHHMDLGPRAGFSVAPDGSAILYPRMDENASNLMLIENFR